MSYDGFVTHSVVHELNEKLLGGKVDKIYQPESDEIVISVRNGSGTYRLLLSADASSARVHLTNIKKENPMTPPMMCMLMRKHLTGGRIVAVSQADFDRIIRIDIETRGELGDLCVRSVITEIMGRHSNIILLDENGKISDAVKHVDYSMSAVRQILPGFMYEAPPRQEKLSPADFNMPDFINAFDALDDDTLLDKYLLDSVMGMSPLIARELVYRFTGSTKAAKSEVDDARFVTFIDTFMSDMLSDRYKPCIAFDPKSGKPSAFSCITLSQYEGIYKLSDAVSISEAIDEFYQTRALHETMRRKSAAVLKLVQNNIERCTKKLVMHRENLIKSKKRDTYKIKADLLTANMYRVSYGAESVTVENFYDGNKELTIKLDPTISPSQNAQKLYTRYNKAKTTEKYSIEQIKDADEELAYLETVLDSIQKAESPSDIDEIKDELRETGYIRSSRSDKKKKKRAASKPLRFESSDGYEILVGRNNRQNDELTIRMSYSTDIWLHTKEIPGSHVLIRTNGSGEAPDRTIIEAASLAAYYSKARNSDNVPVDYTCVKNVRKPNGAKPGFVIYEHNKTVYVTPLQHI